MYKIPPNFGTKYNVIYVIGGRGAGKSTVCAEFMDKLAQQNNNFVGILAAPLLSNAIDQSRLIQKINPLVSSRPSHAYLLWPNGARCYLISGGSLDRGRGLHPSHMWIDRLDEFPQDDRYIYELQTFLSFGATATVSDDYLTKRNVFPSMNPRVFEPDELEDANS